MTRVVILSEWAVELAASLATDFPGLVFKAVERPENVRQQLSEFEPSVAFSIKSPGFPGEVQRKLLACPGLRWLHVGGSGYDHFLPWEDRGLVVTNCAGVLARQLAETVTGMMIALNMNAVRYFKQQQKQVWHPHSFLPLSEQTLLIVGLGRIGSWVARNAKALGMTVLAVRRHPGEERVAGVDEIFGSEDLQSVVVRADFVSLHVRLSAETKNMFGSSVFERMKPGAFLLNTARGPVVDHEAMIDALRSGRLAGAYLDVFDVEPLPTSDPLWSMENVIITPHAADDVFGWQRAFANLFRDNLERWVAGRKMVNVVEI